MFNRNNLLISLFFLSALTACSSNSSTDCAADGPNCQQFNPNQRPPVNLPSPANCAADGPDCKQFNPDLDRSNPPK